MTHLLLTLVLLLFTSSAEAGRVVAVLSFDVDSADANYLPLGRGIANMLITDLERTGRIDVVERARLNALLEELDLQSSAFVDPATAQRLGQGIGASDVLLGGITENDGQMRIDARLVDVDTGEVSITAEATGKADEFFKLEEKLARELTRALRVEVSARNEKQFAARSLGSVAGAVQYGRAVAAYDAGDVSSADQAMQIAASDAGSSKLAKVFEADIKPLPPFFGLLGLTLGARLGTLPGDFVGRAGSIEIGAGYAPSEQFALFGRVALLSAGHSVTIVPTHATSPVTNTVSLYPLEVGARLRVGRIAWHGLYAVGSGGVAPGFQRMTVDETDLLAFQSLLGVSGSGGLDVVFLHQESIGAYAGLHATLAAFHLGSDPNGMLGTGARLQPGIEFRVGYITFGGGQ